jgi:hypothetical protein
MKLAYVKYKSFDIHDLNKAVIVHLSKKQIDIITTMWKEIWFENSAIDIEFDTEKEEIEIEESTSYWCDIDCEIEKNDPIIMPYIDKFERWLFTEKDFIEVLNRLWFDIANRKLLAKQYVKWIWKGTAHYSNIKKILRFLRLWDMHWFQLYNEYAVLKLKKSWIRLIRKWNMIENLLDHGNYELTYESARFKS